MSAVLTESVPTYQRVFHERALRLRYLRLHPEKIVSVKAYYRTHIADFINEWGITVDPRNASMRSGSPAFMPFVLDVKQREWCDWTFQNWLDNEYGGTEKSRDVGLSWLLVAFSVSLCVLYDDFVGGIGSFKQDKVDLRGDMGSLFEKARTYIDGLPEEFRAGFDANTCAPERRLIFPKTRSRLIGEIGDHIGRGNRTGLYFVDEAAYLEHDQSVDAALSKTTRCRQDVSSVCGMQNSFAQRMHDGHSRKFTFHWRDNPRFSQAEYDKFLGQWGPVITAQELDISYTASLEGLVILQVWVQAAIDAHLKLKITPTGVRRGALDIADEGRDKNAFAARHGILLMECKSWSGNHRDVGDTANRAYNLCDDLGLDGFDYDADGGYGSGIRSEANRIDARRRERRMQPKRIEAFRGSGEVFDPDIPVPGTDVLAKDRFQNAKAQAWHSLSERFRNTYNALQGRDYDPDNLISLSSSISELPGLCIELSTPQWKISASGKMMVDKVPEGAASPNRGDSVMMAFAPKHLPMKIRPDLVEDDQT